MDNLIIAAIKKIHFMLFKLWHLLFMGDLNPMISCPTHSRAAPDVSTPEKTLEAAHEDAIRLGINQRMHEWTKWMPFAAVIGLIALFWSK